MNDKRSKFVKLAENRVNKINEIIRLLGNLSNKNSYQYDDTDVEKMFNAIQEELKKSKVKFDVAKKQNETRFKL